MVRNEADKFLPSALDAWQEIADEILALDDNSTDGTRDLLYDRGVYVIEHKGPKAWGNEAAPRETLWKAAMGTLHDWVFILDADMVPAKPVRELLDNDADGVAFCLYDLWQTEPPRYREDRFWGGHRVPRVWLFRNRRSDRKHKFSGRGIHCGHAPQNLELQRVIYAPRDYSLLHYAYSSEEARRRKHQQYNSQGHNLTLHEWLHAQTIVDPNPRLLDLDIDITWPLRQES